MKIESCFINKHKVTIPYRIKAGTNVSLNKITLAEFRSATTVLSLFLV